MSILLSMKLKFLFIKFSLEHDLIMSQDRFTNDTIQYAAKFLNHSLKIQNGLNVYHCWMIIYHLFLYICTQQEKQQVESGIINLWIFKERSNLRCWKEKVSWKNQTCLWRCKFKPCHMLLKLLISMMFVIVDQLLPTSRRCII